MRVHKYKHSIQVHTDSDLFLELHRAGQVGMGIDRIACKAIH